MLPGSLPSHASALAAANLSLGQWIRAWDLFKDGPLFFIFYFIFVEIWVHTVFSEYPPTPPNVLIGQRFSVWQRSRSD
jgi:hypothetical protein